MDAHHGHHHHAAQAGPNEKQAQLEHAGHGNHREHHEHMVADFRRRFWISLILTIPVLALSPMIQHWLGLADRLAFPGSEYVLFVLGSVVFFYGGWPFLTGLVEELQNKRPGMMTLIGLAISVAYIYSVAVTLGLEGEMTFYWELATLIVIMLLGHWIEMRSILGASGALEELVRLLPAEAHRLREDGSTEDVPVSDLHPGDRVLVKPGERVPIDGEVLEGRTSVNQAMLTGESVPIERGPGDKIVGGSVNGESAISIVARKTGQDTYLSQVVRTVQQAQQSRSRSQDLADRAAFWLTIIAIVVGLTTLVVWLAVGRTFGFSIERSVTVMIITCPHALGLAIPLVVAVSTAMAARRGLLIRDRSAFERARNITTVIFDKTGTLTEGRFGVKRVIPMNEADEQRVLTLAAAVESHSEHPIAAGIVAEARGRNLSLPAVSGFRAIPGKGAEATVQENTIRVVSAGYLQERNITVPSSAADQFQRGGMTAVYVLTDEKPIGAIGLADLVRPESRAAVNSLKQMGVEVMMLTGDSQAVAESVAKELGLDDFFAEVLPDKKVEVVRQARQQGKRVCMVGDGVNDAPALVEADLGVAIGAGTDVAIESADVVLVKSDPRQVAAVVRLARASYSKMVQNLAWATGYNVIAIPLAAGVLYSWGILLSPAVGAVVMSASTVIVAVNARLLGRKEMPEA